MTNEIKVNATTWAESAITEQVLDQKPGDVIFIEDDEQIKNGKQHHYQQFLGHVVIFVNFEFWNAIFQKLQFWKQRLWLENSW